jgi:hypothetical protein
MLQEQVKMVFQRNTINIYNCSELAKLNLSLKWTVLFSEMIVNTHSWKKITNEQKEQMKNISITNSEAVFYLANKKKLVGLSLLEELSIRVTNERQRLKAVELIVNNGGVTKNKKALEVIFNQAFTEKNLFDFL